jgi:hypothetical protein
MAQQTWSKPAVFLDFVSKDFGELGSLSDGELQPAEAGEFSSGAFQPFA